MKSGESYVAHKTDSGKSGARIRLLDKNTVNQIAAGEVVESPAAVLKELIENSIDAGSTRIEVSIRDAGRTLLQVSDNGCGMSEADALASLERHATSKIRSLTDLCSARTLGFRGEAVPSIASVSRMRISTAEAEGLRVVVPVEGGTVGPLEYEAGPRGTTVTVADLFFNTPARLRFMKSDTTELRNAVEVVQRLAVAHPEVAFVLRNQGATLFQTSGQGDGLHAIAGVWGSEVARAMIPVDYSVAGVRVRGYISPPEFTRATRAYQWLFVNGRPVRNRNLGTSVELAYRQLTPDRRFALACLHLHLDAQSVDVNVSPTKSEVKFQHEGTVFDAVRHAIKETLLARGLIPSAEGIALANAALGSQADVVREPTLLALGDLGRETLGGGTPFGSGQLAEAFLAGLSPHGNPALADVQSGLSVQAFESGMGGNGAGVLVSSTSSLGGAQGHLDEAFRPDVHSMLEGLRIIGQTRDCFYIIAENRQGLLIVDQHVAHERILFEMLCRERGQAELERQPLLVPETLHLDPRASTVLRERMADIEAVGFELEAFGPGSFLLRGAPAALKGKNPVAFLRDLVEEMMEAAQRNRIVPLREILWITCACKMAIKAGDPMGIPEMEKLLGDLAFTENPYLCPHGRPITIVLTWGDLLRKFKRA